MPDADVEQKQAAPKPHLGAFDFVRVFYCFGVMIFHTFMWPASITLPGPTDERWLPTILGDWLLPLCMAGINGVDVFFMISGFFMTTSLLSQCEKSSDLFAIFSKTVANRWLRLAPVPFVMSIAGILRGDMARFTEFGEPNFSLCFQMLMLTTNYNLPSAMIWDYSCVPLWSIQADWQASVMLCVLVPLFYKKWGDSPNPMLVVMAIFAFIRMAIYIPDPVCNNLTLEIVTLNWFSWDLPLMANDRYCKQVSELRQKIDPTIPDIVDYPHNNPLGCDYHPSQRHHWHWYMNTWYCPMHMRVLPFIVGSVLGYAYKKACKPKTTTPEEEAGMRLFKHIALVISWYWILNTFLPPSMGPPAEILPLILHIVEVVGKILYPGACAVILFSCIVPSDHPFYSACCAKVLGCGGAFKCLSGLTYCIYCSHFLIANLFIEWFHFEFTLAGCLASLGVTVALTLPLALFLNKCVEVPVERMRRNAFRKS